MTRLLFSLTLVVFLAALTIPFASQAAAAAPGGLTDVFDELADREIAEGLYYRMVDEEGRVIMETGRHIQAGDQYLARDNRLYEVVLVENRVGHARYVHTESTEVRNLFQAANAGGSPASGLVPAQVTQPEEAEQHRYGSASGLVPVQARPNRLVAVYHTHNGESYVPTRGRANVNGRGDIHAVGMVFQETLEKRGVEVIHDETIHLPHDRGAYRRSRNTAAQLLAREPDAVFDIHRDAAPWHTYAEKVEGQWVAQVMFVVGRQNPHFAVNRSFALDLKNYIDTVYPGLVRGVFYANGNYNQDLHPLKLLLEVGAHENTRRAAKEGIALFAEGFQLYLYGPEPGRPDRAPVQQRNQTPVWRNILLVLLVVGAAGGGFYWLNYPEAAERLKGRLRAQVAVWGGRIKNQFERRRSR
ncbi:MAG: stage II sporulation protein P [Bacillota bacterium]